MVFVLTCRKYASELAINDTGTRTLLDALRAAIPTERAFRQSQVDAAVRRSA